MLPNHGASSHWLHILRRKMRRGPASVRRLHVRHQDGKRQAARPDPAIRWASTGVTGVTGGSGFCMVGFLARGTALVRGAPQWSSHLPAADSGARPGSASASRLGVIPPRLAVVWDQNGSIWWPVACMVRVFVTNPGG